MRKTAHEPQEPGPAEKALLFPRCCLDIKQLRLGRQLHSDFLMKSNDWILDDGNLCVGNWQLQRGENRSKQWKV